MNLKNAVAAVPARRRCNQALSSSPFCVSPLLFTRRNTNELAERDSPREGRRPPRWWLRQDKTWRGDKRFVEELREQDKMCKRINSIHLFFPPIWSYIHWRQGTSGNGWGKGKWTRRSTQPGNEERQPWRDLEGTKRVDTRVWHACWHLGCR